MKNIYSIISLILQPLLMPTYGMLILININVFDALPLNWRVIAILGTIVFTGVVPAVPILLLMKKGAVHDLFISRREERTMPYLISLFAYIFWTFFLWHTLQLPLFLVAIGVGISLSILLIMLINLKWKISAHLSGIGGLAGGVFGISYRMAYNPVWLFVIILFLSALVALSRIELEAHTSGQTLAGFLLGFMSVILPCLFL